MPYTYTPPKEEKRRPCSTIEVNGLTTKAPYDEAPIKAHPVRLTIRSKIKLPDQLAGFASWGNNLSAHFAGSPEMKRSWGRRKVVYEGYITHTRLEGALRLIAEYSGVTATVVYL